jgi:hypothetical protein
MPLLRTWPSLLYLLRAITAFKNPLHSCVYLKVTIVWLRSNCVLSNSEQGEKNNLQQGNHARLAAQLFHRATFDVSKETRSAAYLSLYISF